MDVGTALQAQSMEWWVALLHASPHSHPWVGLRRVFGSLNLTRVKLRGVGESFKRHLDYESKGIKAHFNMDESGVLSLDRVSAVPGPGTSSCFTPPPTPLRDSVSLSRWSLCLRLLWKISQRRSPR